MLPTTFPFILPSGFKGEDFFKSANQKQELSMVAMFINGSELNVQSLQRTFQGCFLPRFDSFYKVVLEKTIFQKSANQKQKLSVVAMFVNESELNEQCLQSSFQRSFLPSFDSFGQAISVETIFQKLTNHKQELHVVAMFVIRLGRNEQSLQRTCHRCFLPSFGSFGQAVSKEKIFLNRPIRNKN